MGHIILAALGGLLAGGSLGFWIAVLALHRHAQSLAEGYDVSDRFLGLRESEAPIKKDSLVCQ
jgi:hypothetical protein